MIKLAFVGKPNSGQWEASRYLQQHYKFKPIRFIDGPKKICRIIYHYKKWTRYPWKTVRDIYDAMYKLDPAIWLGHVTAKVVTSTRDIVIDDPHYINEVEGLRQLGFTIVRFSANKKNRATSIGRSLGTKVIPGNVVLSEYFNKDVTTSIKVDYSIYFEDTASLFKTLDELVKTLNK